MSTELQIRHPEFIHRIEPSFPVSLILLDNSLIGVSTPLGIIRKDIQKGYWKDTIIWCFREEIASEHLEDVIEILFELYASGKEIEKA